MNTEQTFRFLERRAEKAGKGQNLGLAEVVYMRLAKGVVVGLKFRHEHTPVIMRYFRGSTVALFRIAGFDDGDRWVHAVVSNAANLSWFPIRQAAKSVQDYVADIVNEALYTKNLGLDAFSQDSTDDIILVDQNESYDEIMITEDLAAADDLNFL